MVNKREQFECQRLLGMRYANGAPSGESLSIWECEQSGSVQEALGITIYLVISSSRKSRSVLEFSGGNRIRTR